MGLGLGDGHGHTAVFEGARRIEPFALEPHVRFEPFGKSIGVDQRSIAFLKRHHVVHVVEIEPRGVFDQQPVPTNHGEPRSMTRIQEPTESTESNFFRSSMVACTFLVKASWVRNERRRSEERRGGKEGRSRWS